MPILAENPLLKRPVEARQPKVGVTPRVRLSSRRNGVEGHLGPRIAYCSNQHLVGKGRARNGKSTNASVVLPKLGTIKPAGEVVAVATSLLGELDAMASSFNNSMVHFGLLFLTHEAIH